MKLKKVELTVIFITLMFLCFTAGFFVGRGKSVSVVSVSAQDSSAESGQTGAVPDMGTESDAALETDDDADSDVGGKLDLNAAAADELAALSGIGEVLAQRIIDYRDENGDFTAVGDIMDVYGIGEAKYNAIKDYITVG